MAARKQSHKVKNLLDEKIYVDTLHLKAIGAVACSSETCMGSLMSQQAHRPSGSTPRKKEEILDHASDFFDQYYTSMKKNNTQAHITRMSEVRLSVLSRGTYELTNAELTYGAKLGWRNAARCIGRIQWSKLQVFDARHVLTSRGMFEAICKHIKYGTNNGNLRSSITIFPKRLEGRPDFRVWNSHLIRYAGYKMDDGTVIGDPANVTFTEQCIKLGWKPKYGKFDVLPLVLSAAGADPEVFEIPPNLVLEVKIEHPQYPWFAELGLKWHALPGVAGMLFDCGGIEYPACPFNGWYMGTEIGARNFCDVNRYNITEIVAEKLNLNTENSTSLWKDRVILEVNIAVLHSFQMSGVTITDHHSASESFIKHMENEHKLRGGCPGDWVWVVPPLGGSSLEVFHQEMLLYKLKPSYEYQEDAWLTHTWRRNSLKILFDIKRERPTFKYLARAVLFATILMRKALHRRVKCIILYATETGKSERFAKTLFDLFKRAFDVKVTQMDEYDVSSLEHESLVLIVTSTFGNGEPPGNGEDFADELYEMMQSMILEKTDLPPRRHSTFVRMSVQVEKIAQPKKSSAGRSRSSSLEDKEIGPLCNVRYSVFGLGSKAYPRYAAFGAYMDKLFADLGAERLYPVIFGDELCGQEQSFRHWAHRVFEAACRTFCFDEEIYANAAKEVLNSSNRTWSENRFRLIPVENGKEPEINDALSQIHAKKLYPCILSQRIQLQHPDSDRQTILVKLNTQGASELMYVPGDHVGIFPANNSEIVDGILDRLEEGPPSDTVIRTETLNTNGASRSWGQVQQLPVCSMRTAFTYILDVTAPPSQELLQLLVSQTSSDTDKEMLKNLATDYQDYENWKKTWNPTILEVLEQFSSLKVPASLLLTQLPLLNQRYYSISSSLKMHPGEIHATVVVVKFRTQNGAGPFHEGVCSGWLNRCTTGTIVPCYIGSASSFHLPEDRSTPILMIGAGTGIAPFRSFWQQRMIDLEMSASSDIHRFGEMTLYFGCRMALHDNIYGTELIDMEKSRVLSTYYIALSREPDLPKIYVQDLLLNNAALVFEMIVSKGGHIYVCGNVLMANDVNKAIEEVLQQQGRMKPEEATAFIYGLRDDNRYHEDIFGVNLKTPGVTQKRPSIALEFLRSSSSASLRKRADSILT